MSGRIKKVISTVLSAAMLAAAVPSAMADDGADVPTAAAVSGYVSTTVQTGSVELVSRTKTPVIHVDDNDYDGVIRAAGDLVNDIKSVTDVEPTMGSADSADVIIGTIGKSAAIDALVKSGKLNVSEIDGKWECFTIQNVDGKIVIAGSDKRGTIYGIYDLSEKIGVSPWYFWADVVIGHADALYITLPAGGYTEGEPSVKYRGIFLNDEYNLTQWSTSMGSGNMNNETYEKIFELLLRLKANYLWPAMHKYSTAFNATANNAKLADEYGIVMGSSHCEPILRNNLGELYAYEQEWKKEHPDKTLYHNSTIKDDNGHQVAYIWTDKDDSGKSVDNKEFLTDYWTDRVKANGGYENTYTLGMRGVHDGSFWTNSTGSWTDIVQDIIDIQGEILEKELCKNGIEIEDIPQVFIPYKEMLEYYNKGLKVPDYVTLMWTDDNFGYIRQLPTEAEAKRSGGAGIYYHLSYYGRPTSYLWLSTTSPALIREEMTKAYDMDAKEIWVANVGDLKPAETEIEYFLDLARDVENMRDLSVQRWLADKAQRDFGFDYMNSMLYASLKMMYYDAVSDRRPEHMVNGLYSLTDFGDEGQQILDYYEELADGARNLYDTLPDSQKPSFYELLLYPALGAKSMAEKYIYADKAKYYADNGYGAAANKYAALSNAANAQIDTDTALYTSMLNGKWAKMMNPRQTQLSGSFGGPITGALNPPTVTTLPYTTMTVVPEGGGYGLSFSRYSSAVKYIDIINTGTGSFDWELEDLFDKFSDNDWLVINKTSGTVADNDRIYLSVDTSKLPEKNPNVAVLQFTRYVNGEPVQKEYLDVYCNGNVVETGEKTYIESDGYVSIEAEHYTKSVKNGVYEWKVEGSFGRSGNSVKIYPNRAATVSTPNKQNSAYLEYQVYFTSSGTFPIDVYRMPTLNELSNATVSYQIGVDDSTPTRYGCNRAAKDKSDGTDVWGKGVLQNTDIVSGQITIPSAGLHTIRLYNESPGVVIDKFVITTGEKKASYFGAPESYNTTYNSDSHEVPAPSEPSEEQTGSITPLFEPKLLIGTIDGEKVNIVKLADIDSAVFVVATYTGTIRNMTQAAYTTIDLSDIPVNGVKTVEVETPNFEAGHADNVQYAIINSVDVNDENAFEALAPAITKTYAYPDDISLSTSYDNGYVYPVTRMNDYYGKESVCVITDEDGYIKYIRQNTVAENTYSQIPFNGEGKYTLKIKIAGEDGIITENFNTVHNIDPNVDPTSETLYDWNFSSKDQLGNTGDKNVPVLGSSASYDEANKTVNLGTPGSMSDSLRVDFDAPVTMQQGDTITVVTNIGYVKDNGNFTDYTIKDSAGNPIVYTHITEYNGGQTNLIKIGDATVLETDKLNIDATAFSRHDNLASAGYTTHTTTIDASSGDVTFVVSSKAGTATYTGKLPENSSYDIASITVSTNHSRSGKQSYANNISLAKSKAAAYKMTLRPVKKSTGGMISGGKITVTDGLTGANIAPETNGKYNLCDGIYNYTVEVDGFETVSGILEVSPATESYIIAIPMTWMGDPDAEPTDAPAPTPEPTPEPTPAPDSGYTITGDVSDRVLNAVITDNENDTDVTAYIAEYNGNALIKVAVDEEAKGGKTITDYVLDENTTKVKIFLWENNMHPVTDAVFEKDIEHASAPTAEPTSVPTIEPTAAPTAAPTPTPEPAPDLDPDTEYTTDITIKFVDEEGNQIKDDVTLSGYKFHGQDKYTVPNEYLENILIESEDGYYYLYTLNESTSKTSEYLESGSTVFNLTFNGERYDYYNDFENLTVDTSDTDTWHKANNASYPTIESDHTKYLKHATTSSSTGGYMNFDAVDTENKVVKLTADVKFTKLTSGTGLGQFAISNRNPSFSSNNIGYGIENSSGHIFALMYRGANSTLEFNKKTASIDFADQWIHIEAEADFGQETVTVKLTNENGEVWEGTDSFYSSTVSGNIGSIYLRSPGENGTLSVDNLGVKIIGEAVPAEPNITSAINHKSVYAFGDSIVYGHNAPDKSFMRLIANDYALKLNMMAKNGATIMSSSNQILTQINNAPAAAPDIVVLEGYTNDAYGSKDSDSFNAAGTNRDVTTCYGEVSPEGTTTFDTNTFCGSFEQTIKAIKDKWPEAEIVFVTIHESNARNHDIQVKLRELSMAACEKWDVPVVDMFTYENEQGNRLDTFHNSDSAYMNKYIINGAGSHPTEVACREFYIPAVVEVLEGLYNE